jgi:hypothetical protein
MLSNELLTFLRRTSEGGYRLEAQDGSIMLESRSYHELREDLDVLLRAMPVPPRSVKVLIGRPRQPPRAAPPPHTAAGPLVSHG